MTRTLLLKTVYFARLTGLLIFAIAAAASAKSGEPILAMIWTALLATVLLSGRIQAYFWSELLSGLHYLNQRDYEKAKVHTQLFLLQLRRSPWLRYLIWLGPSSYSLNAEVMALNNLGGAEIELGSLDAARLHLERAMALDPKCPLPHRNMGILIMRQGSFADAKPWLEKAVALGFGAGATDRLVRSSQRHNASFSTTGKMSDTPLPCPTTDLPPSGTYVITLLNNDLTPFDLVVALLEKVFGMTGSQAFRTARQVDKLGHAVCAGFNDKAAAQQKADELIALAQEQGHALACTVNEPAR